MKTLKLIAISCFLLAACTKGNVPDTNDGKFAEAPKCGSTVSVKVYNAGETKASSSFLEENIDRFTATRLDTKSNNFTLVSYHGRNKENIGMVQLIQPTTKAVLSEIVFTDARVNFAQYRKTTKGEVVYIGVDRGEKGYKKPICGIVCVPVKSGKFYVGETDEAELTPYKVDGVSINCIKNHNGDTNQIDNDIMVVATGGNNALGEDGQAGFTKFQIDSEDLTKLTVLAKEVNTNFRGYWFSYGYNNGGPLAYTYRTVEDGALVYKVAAISFADGKSMFQKNDKFIGDFPTVTADVYKNPATTENFGRFCAIALNYKNQKFVITGIDQKDGGVKVYRYKQNDAENGGQPSLTLVDFWKKSVVCLSTEIIDADGMYILAGCGDGVYKVRVEFDLTDTEHAKATLIPVAKRKTTALTESGTLSSTNYMQVKNNQIHVAGGYEGYYILDINSDEFGPCDTRTDFSL